ncbi:alpha/beta hydrolase [bacterium M00.F.Ca.ET.194.01.1.1]|uniref:alpha/beta fold hydrolase n=1 Tax=Agrobacterium pusense TaxID=648995 RepID=UPI001092849F|nr:alpha/beta hydrolase [Agrobacterium pusense]TGR72417.1 alpha/beta hydrolase [bacterium M00.F.Ca.ET.194.01.1.1]TGS57318.1 alpha/beta hydrolase [bacterium M00.F.Ca.ET.179.01.1.1]TGV50249.1 alpha/beta hydrolase [bacterium M00.F.Ca.ET.168.01.1.1]
MIVVKRGYQSEGGRVFKSAIDTSHGAIAYIDTRGTGVPLVMVHANSLCKEEFTPQIKVLSGVRRVIAFDLPGHGSSENAKDPGRTYNMSGYADALLEALERMTVNRFLALGHSLGGHVVLEMIAKNAAIDGAMIFGTPPIVNSVEGVQAGFKPSPEMAYTGSPILSDDQVLMVAELALGPDGAEEFFLNAVRRTDGSARQLMIESALRGEGSNQRRTAETSPVPLAVVNGENDPVINLDYIDSLHFANIWGGEPIRVKGAGHAVHWEQATRFNELLLRFEDFVNGGRILAQEAEVHCAGL